MNNSNTVLPLVLILGGCLSRGFSAETAESFVDRVEKASTETDQFFGDWLWYNGPIGIVEEQRECESYLAFGRIMVLAGQADDADVDESIARLPTASPRTAALLLAVLFHQNDLKLLPTIARSLDDKRIAFQYEEGSPDSRYAIRISAGIFPAPGLLQKTQSVGEIARMLLKWWGYDGHQQSFDDFWMARKDRPYSAIQLYLQTRRAKDEVTGAPKRQQIEEALRRIESLPEPAKYVVRLAVVPPAPRDNPGLYEARRRNAVASLDRAVIIGILQGHEPIIPRDPDVNSKAFNPLYATLVDGILRYRDVREVRGKSGDTNQYWHTRQDVLDSPAWLA